MASYSEASTAALASIQDAATGGLVEEYEIQSGGSKRRVKRGRVADQVVASLTLEGIAARRASGGPFRLAKFREVSR